jgi:phage shock protein A
MSKLTEKLKKSGAWSSIAKETIAEIETLEATVKRLEESDAPQKRQIKELDEEVTQLKIKIRKIKELL